MEVSLDELRSVYQSRSTEELLVLLAQGGLTEEAQMVLMAELRGRGYADQASALDAAVQTHAVVAETARVEEQGRKTRSLKHRVIGFVLISGLSVLLSALAPYIWRSPADRQCQRAGYWYAESVGLDRIKCFGWKFR